MDFPHFFTDRQIIKSGSWIWLSFLKKMKNWSEKIKKKIFIFFIFIFHITKLTSLCSLICPHLEYIICFDRGPLRLLLSMVLLVSIHQNLLFFPKNQHIRTQITLHILNRRSPMREKIIYSRWEKIKEHSDVSFVIWKMKMKKMKIFFFIFSLQFFIFFKKHNYIQDPLLIICRSVKKWGKFIKI